MDWKTKGGKKPLSLIIKDIMKQKKDKTKHG
jgi:hypothetical protein